MAQLGLILSEDDIHAMMKSVGIGPHGKISYAGKCPISLAVYSWGRRGAPAPAMLKACDPMYPVALAIFFPDHVHVVQTKKSFCLLDFYENLCKIFQSA
jgi:hypothetical protein